MVTSTFACVVSVKRRNLTPVKVLKHCMRKFSVSRTSRPDDGSGLLPGSVAPGKFFTGLRREVIA